MISLIRQIQNGKFLFIVIAFICSCNKGKNARTNVVSYLQSGIVNSNEQIDYENYEFYKKIDEQLTNILSRDKARLWHPRAKIVKLKTEEIISLIDSFKFAINQTDHSTISKQGAFYLYDRISKYREFVEKVMDKVYRNNFDKAAFPLPLSDSKGTSAALFYEELFLNTANYEQKAILIGIKNDIKKYENMLVKYCFYNSFYYNNEYGYYSIIVNQNCSILKPGDVLEISAGIGSYSRAAQAKVNINNKEVQTLATGIGIYKFRVGTNIGIDSVPVVIEFTDHFGEKVVKKLNLKYTIKN